MGGGSAAPTTSHDTSHDTHYTGGDYHLSAEYQHEVEILHYELKIAAHDLNEAMVISCIQLMFPINLLTKFYFLKATNRQDLQLTAQFLIEAVLFGLQIMWLYVYVTF